MLPLWQSALHILHLLLLQIGDQVGLRLDDGTVYSDSCIGTSFSGFPYSPLRNNRAAFSVYLTQDLTVSTV